MLSFNLYVRNFEIGSEYFWSAPKDSLTHLRPGTWGTVKLLPAGTGNGAENPIAFIHERKPGMLVDVWTLYAQEQDLERVLRTALEAGVDQISSPTAALLVDSFKKMSR